MLANFTSVLVHFIGVALSCAQIAYWSVRLMTAPTTSAPAATKAVSVSDPDPVLLARAFGLVERAAAGAGNIQVAGVFAAGKDSAAVMRVDDRPARAVLLGQEVAPGTTLVEVGADGVTVESGGVRRQLRVAAAPLATLSAPPASDAFTRRGNVLSAPSVDAAGAGPAASVPRSLQPRRPPVSTNRIEGSPALNRPPAAGAANAR